MAPAFDNLTSEPFSLLSGGSSGVCRRAARTLRFTAMSAVVIATTLSNARAAPLPTSTISARPAAVATPRGQDGDPISRSVAARARMLECGHQWSAMKKAGTATGTWKEFSRGCLAQR